MKTRGREEKGERVSLVVSIITVRANSPEDASFALPSLGSLGILMPSVPAICNRDESLHHVSILPQVFLS